jgi:hypothetical protein
MRKVEYVRPPLEAGRDVEGSSDAHHHLDRKVALAPARTQRYRVSEWQGDTQRVAGSQREREREAGRCA